MAVRQEHGVSVTGDARRDVGREGSAREGCSLMTLKSRFVTTESGLAVLDIHERNLVGVKLDRLGMHQSKRQSRTRTPGPHDVFDL